MGHDQQPDYYEILGLEPSASPDEITRAYRKTMRAVHPDTNGTIGLFRLVKVAYDTLKDPVSRAAYDSRQAAPAATPPPPEAPPRTEPPKEPPERSRTEPPSKGPGTADWPHRAATANERGESARSQPVRSPSTIQVRPRFGAHRVRVAGIGASAVVCLMAVYALWPAGFPASFFLLVLLPVIAAPIIALQAGLRSRPWPWLACAVPFSGTAVLAVADAGNGLFWPLTSALAALTLAGAGLTVSPRVVARGRELDRLVDPGSIDYQIFNIPGAGLTSAAAKQVARISADRLEGLAHLTGVRIVHGLVPPQLPGRARCYVDHAVLRNDRLALVMVRSWPAAAYAWTDEGFLTANGSRIPGGDTGITAAATAVRKVVPRGTRVRGFVAVLPENAANAAWLDFAPPAHDDLFAGTLNQVYERLAAWLGETDSVIRRCTFAALLPHIHRT